MEPPIGPESQHVIHEKYTDEQKRQIVRKVVYYLAINGEETDRVSVANELMKRGLLSKIGGLTWLVESDLREGRTETIQ